MMRNNLKYSKFLDFALNFIAPAAGILTLVFFLQERLSVVYGGIVAFAGEILYGVFLVFKAMKKKHTVYFSYSSKDRETVKKIRECIERYLRRNAVQSFTILTEDSISVGDNINETITSFIKRSERVVVFISKSYIESEFCQKELSLCMKGTSKNVIPVFLDIPDNISNLPEDLKNIKAVVLDESSIESEKEIAKIADALIKK